MYLVQGVRSCIFRGCAAWIACLTALSLSSLLPLSAHASPPLPGVTFVGAQSTVGASSDWDGPVGVAADTQGNVFVASYLGGYISEVNLATGNVTRMNFSVRNPQDMKIANGILYIASQGDGIIKGYSLSTHALVQSLPMPGVFALAIDKAGDIYAGVDAGAASAIYVFPSGSSTPTAVRTAGLTSMTGLAIDSTGMLYAADTAANTVYKLDPSNGYTMTPLPIYVTSPRGMIIDSNDRLYLAAAGTPNADNGSVYRYPAGSYQDSSAVMLAQGLNYNEEVTLASNGDEYVTSFAGGTVIRISPQSNFGTIVPVGSWSRQTLVFSVNAGTTIGSVVVGTTDSTTGNFSVSNNSCLAETYLSSTVCSLTLQYNPLQPALAHGTIQVLDSDSGPLSTVYSSGIGLAPQIVFTPSPRSVDIGLGTLYGIVPLPGQNAAVTTDSSLYVGNLNVTPTLITSGLAQPHEIAVDAQNNLFIADTGNSRVITVPGGGTPATPTTFSTSTASFTGVAVDGAGSIYYADATNNQIIRRDWADTAYGVENVVAKGIANLGAITVDNAHNLFVISGNNVLELIWQNGAYGAPATIGSGFSSPGGIALDGADDVYVSDSGNQNFVEIPNAGGTYGSQITLLSSGQGDLQQAIIQPNGLLYIVGGSSGKVVVADRTAPTLAFGSTPVLTTNSDGPLTILTQNIGTSSATFSPAPSGNPSSNSASFTLNGSSTTCPVATTASQGLPSGATCVVAIDYTPQTISSTSGTLTFTDDALNVLGSTQGISLTGTATPQHISVSVSSSAASITPGEAVTVSVSLTGPTGALANGSVVISDNGSVIATVPVTNGVATFTTTSLASGTHALTATYTGSGVDSGAVVSDTGTVNVTVATLDFTMKSTGANYQPVVPGGSASYGFALSPSYTSYPAAVTFAVTGLPAGATYTITPSNVAANGGATTAVLTINTAATTVASNHLNGAATLALATLLLPFGVARRLRKSDKLGNLLMLAVIAGTGLVGIAGLTGCSSGNGFIGKAPANYTITVTATSGSVQHASTVTLNLQ